ncbi:ribbon-helix-helix domain-containing protein [Proteus mirabilis]|uniref:Ribbon-helix-helix domain-containing protein n=1 Tax=Proteus mirabilis TaxID=584 RepID=A0ABD5LWP1_PROMI
MSIKSELIATKVDIELKEAFVAIARNKHRPASQILRDLIRVYVESNQTQPNEKTLNTFAKTDKGDDVFMLKMPMIYSKNWISKCEK